MSTPNKYHSSGREYTATELTERRRALTPVYLVLGYAADPMARLKQGKLLPHDVGRNKRKQQACEYGFKSLKQWDRRLDRSAQY